MLNRFIFLTTLDEVEKYVRSNSSDNCIHLYDIKILIFFGSELQLIKDKPVIKSKLKELLNDLKKLKSSKVVLLDSKKRDGRKIFLSRTKLIACDSDIDKAFISMHQSITTKIKSYACKDWIVLDVIIKLIIKIFES